MSAETAIPGMVKKDNTVLAKIVKNKEGQYVLDVPDTTDLSPMDWLLILEQFKVTILTNLNANMTYTIVNNMTKEGQNEQPKKKEN